MGHQGQTLSRKRDKNIDQVPISQRAAKFAVMDHVDSDYFMWFESRESTFNDILKALRDDNISRVAVYGLSGSGKTSLAKQVGKRAKELNMFNVVVVVVVARAINVKKIQGEVAEVLGLRLGEEDDLAARRKQISERLRYEERVLIILDDIWQRLDLQEIGLLNDGSSNCKVLLTMRSREVGYLMGCQRIFHLFLLTDEEGWNLLSKRSCIDDGSRPELVVVAKEVARHCKGLPLPILVIGSTLRGKTIGQCMEVLKSLQGSNGDIHYVISSVMQVSYNGSKVVKTIFSICGLFPEDNDIFIEDLSQHVIKLGICSRNDVLATINSLKGCNLLMHSDKSKDHVIMHNLVHDIAMTMIYKENPTKWESIHEYKSAMHTEEDFQWHEELGQLLLRLYGVSEHPSCSTSNATFCNAGEGIVLCDSSTKTDTIPKPSGKLVDFYGLCRVDKSFIPLLKEACAKKPHLIESQRRRSEMLRQSAFDSLGRLLFLLHNVRVRDWIYYKDELQMFWEQTQLMKFDLEWLSPKVERVLSSSEIDRIEALREEEKYWNQEAAKLQERLKIIENKAADIRTEIAFLELKLNSFAMADVSKVQGVPTPPWRKIFLKK